jgi:hypothetical protein
MVDRQNSAGDVRDRAVGVYLGSTALEVFSGDGLNPDLLAPVT